MSKPKRYQTEAEIIADIDKLKDDIPALYDRAKAAKHEADQYLAQIADKIEDFDKTNEPDENHPRFVCKRLKRLAKRAASAPIRQEKKIKALAEALAEFRTERMAFLEDRSVVAK